MTVAWRLYSGRKRWSDLHLVRFYAFIMMFKRVLCGNIKGDVVRLIRQSVAELIGD